MPKSRKQLQGVWNVIRFNWHFYVLSIVVICISFFIVSQTHSPYNYLIGIQGVIVAISTLLSVAVSWYVYDYSRLYSFEWLQVNELPKRVLNINAGFDETSEIIKAKLPRTELFIIDFYSLIEHAEISIKRARKAYQPLPETINISTPSLPFKDSSIDYVFAILSVHEIRDNAQRVLFFKELHRVVTDGGQIVVTEHLRDTANFFAYNIGAFHFLSRKTWLNTFSKAGLKLDNEMKVTPYITTFILRKHGSIS